MRKLKYRAWDIKGKEMVQDSLVLSGTGQLVTVNADYFNNPFSFFDGCIWMEYIGLTDKNGKEIYEGDILAFDNHEVEFPAGDADRMIVEWHEEYARFGLTFYSIYGGEGYTGHTENIHEYIRQGAYVIGNIHANPEL